MLVDNHGRVINYMRLAVTDRCNLRCSYCMPAHGLDWLSRSELLSWEELLRLSRIMIGAGISKIRITGGEPFVRKGLMEFLEQLANLDGLSELTMTTNGVLTAPHVSTLARLGVKSINLSIDTLDAQRFALITRRDELPQVMQTLDALLAHNIIVKLNTVVMAGVNTDDIVPLVALTKDLPIQVRFIEEMPFNGDGHRPADITWNYKKIIDTVSHAFGPLIKVSDGPYSTSVNYFISGHTGGVGVIPAYSRTFCGTCNRLRVTPVGMIKTCLYDGGVLNIKDVMRSGANDEVVLSAVKEALQKRSATGWEAERVAAHQSMASIGG